MKTLLTKDEQNKVREALGCTDAVKCKHCVDDTTSWDGERYTCERCDYSYFLDYDEMR